MPRSTVRFTEYRQGIQAHFTRNGAVSEDAEAVRRRGMAAAKGFASTPSPYAQRYGRVPTGHLASTITSGSNPNFGRLTYTITIRAGAYYATWVNDGTGDLGPGPWRRLPPAGRFAHATVTNRGVKGQKPKRYLERGLAVGLKSRGYSTAGLY